MSWLPISVETFSQDKISKNLNFFFKNKHFSFVRFIIEIFFTPDFCKDSITEGETPPAPMINAFLLEALSISFKYAACSPKTSVFSPTIKPSLFKKRVLTEPVRSASLMILSI